jgi:hypothetical protein
MLIRDKEPSVLGVPMWIFDFNTSENEGMEEA